jgi:hypothetical protein
MKIVLNFLITIYLLNAHIKIKETRTMQAKMALEGSNNRI